MYYYEINGTFTTTFGLERGKHPIFVYSMNRPIDPKIEEDRKKYWPTNAEEREQALARLLAARKEGFRNKIRRYWARLWANLERRLLEKKGKAHGAT